MRLEPNKWGFHWHGRTKEGVNKWTGSIKPLLWIGRIFGVYGPAAAIAGFVALIYGLIARHLVGPTLSLMMVGLIHGAIFSTISYWALYMHRRVSHLAPAHGLEESLGLDAAAVREVAEQRNIQPKIILNDEPYYDPTEFVEALSLVRASSAPTTGPEALLRPARSVNKSESYELLRAQTIAEERAVEPATVEIQRLGG